MTTQAHIGGQLNMIRLLDLARLIALITRRG